MSHILYLCQVEKGEDKKENLDYRILLLCCIEDSNTETP